MSMNVEISRISRILTVNIQQGGKNFRDLIFHGRGTRGFKELSVITFLFFATSTFPGGTMQGTDGEGQPRLVHPWPQISVSPGELLDIPKPTV